MQEIQGEVGGEGAGLRGVGREGGGGERAKHAVIWAKNLLGRGSNKCRGSENSSVAGLIEETLGTNVAGVA